ncbi:histidine kinase [Nonomuraea sp. NPDC004354]
MTPQLRLARTLILICLAVQLAVKVSQLVQASLLKEQVALVPGLLIVVALEALFVPIAFRRASPATARWNLVAQALLASSFYLVQSPWTPVMAMLVASLLLTLKARTAWPLVVLILAGEFSVRAAFYPELGSLSYWSALATLGPGVGLYAVCWLHDLIRQTDAARAEIGQLEAARERLRVARDLCDALGDKLSALVHRFDRADLVEVVGAARQALTDVRSIADDHRDRTLAAELEATRSVLTAAGVDAEVTTHRPRLPLPVDGLLARVLRRTMLAWLSTDPPERVLVELEADTRFVVLRAGRTGGRATELAEPSEPNEPNELGELGEEAAELGGCLTSGAGWTEVRLPVTPVKAAASGPLAGAPWLAWFTLVILEVDTLGSTVVNMIRLGSSSAFQVVTVAVFLPVVSGLQLYNGLPRRGARPRAWRWTLGAQIVLMVTAMAIIGQRAGSYVGLTAGTTLFLVRSAWAWALGFGPLLGGVALWIAQTGVPLWGAEYAMVMIGFTAMAYGLSTLPLAAFQLEEARRDLARMAVLQERLRVARDLHDLLGFRLSAIVLKGELLIAGPDSADPSELRELAEQALVDVRSITGGPAPLSLREEAATARSMLAASGVEVTVDLPPVRLPPETDSLLAVVLREAVTNVVRHAQATWCAITVRDAVRLTVSNNGATASAPREGTGLANLTRRLEEAGGRLSVERDGGRFTLTAEVPCSEPAGLGGDADGVHPVTRVELGHR